MIQPALRAVGDDSNYEIVTPEGAPIFEGNQIGGFKVKLSGTSGLEIDDLINLDDVVRMVVEGRVTGIAHIVDEKSGLLYRVHTIKVTEATRVSYDYEAEADRA